MKLKIFNRGKGWYVSATNYRDQDDKCYVNIGFNRDEEPEFTPNSDGWQMLDIDVLEGKFNCYKGKPGFHVFKYTKVTNKDENRDFAESIQGTKYEKMFGSPNVKVDDSDLPFL